MTITHETDTVTPEIEADFRDAASLAPPKPSLLSPERDGDGSFIRQGNWFDTRFGPGPGQAPVEAGRYFILGSLGCGWARRQNIVLRLLGLSEAAPFHLLTTRDSTGGWVIAERSSDIRRRFGFTHLDGFYAQTNPSFTGRATSPTVIDGHTGKVVSNDYHVLPQQWEVAWRELHAPGAPDLYPAELRQSIDLLNQQLFDDVNNGTYKVIFAKNPVAAKSAFDVFYARLAEYDFRLTTRRYLFGDRITDSDIRLFQTLSSFERAYRPALAKIFGEAETKQIWDFPHLWAYARDLFAQGFASELEQYFLGLVPGPSGDYLAGKGFLPPGYQLRPPAESLAAWQEPAGRESLGGSPVFSGPGGGGTTVHWTFNALTT